MAPTAAGAPIPPPPPVAEIPSRMDTPTARPHVVEFNFYSTNAPLRSFPGYVMPPNPRPTAKEHAAGAGVNATVSLPQVGAAVLVQWPDKQTASDTGTWPAIVLEVDRAASAVRFQYMGTGGGHRRRLGSTW